MDFLGNVKKMVTDTAQTAVKKSGEIFETTKIKYSIFDLKNDIDIIYKEIGELIYTKFETDVDVFNEVNEKCELIKEKKVKIEQLKKEMSEIKNSISCEECSNACSNNMDYCPKCGAKLKDDASESVETVFEAEVVE